MYIHNPRCKYHELLLPYSVYFHFHLLRQLRLHHATRRIFAAKVLFDHQLGKEKTLPRNFLI